MAAARASETPGYDLIAALDDPAEIRLTAMLLALRGRRSLVLIDSATPIDLQAIEDVADRVVRCADMTSTASVVDALAPHAADLRAVTPTHDRLWPSVFGAVCRLLGPRPDLEGSLNARIKPRMRRLTATVAPVPWRLARASDLSTQSVNALMNAVGLPLVIKPIWGQSSNHVEIVERKDEVRPALQRTFEALSRDHHLVPFNDGQREWDPRREVLVERLMHGTEFSLEAVVARRCFRPLLIQEKHIMARRDGFRFETCNLAPSPFLTAGGEAAIHALGRDVVSCLGLDDTVLHIEVIWDGQTANLVEVNPRMGGGGVPRTLAFWFDTTVRDWPVRLHCGEELPRIGTGRDGFLAGVFINAEHGGVYRGVSELKWVRSLPGFQFDVEYYRPGQIVPEWTSARGVRQECLYAYDAFFWRHDPSEILPLHAAVRDRVRILTESDRNAAGAWRRGEARVEG